MLPWTHSHLPWSQGELCHLFWMKHVSIQGRRHSQLSLSIFPICSSILKAYTSSTLSRSSWSTTVFCSPPVDIPTAKATQRVPKTKIRTISDQLDSKHILCSCDTLSMIGYPQHMYTAPSITTRGKTDLTTGTHWWKGIGTTGKNLLAINNQHSDIVLALFL